MSKSNEPIDILIVGTGAVGAFYGSRLAFSPRVRLSLVCRSNYKAVSTRGLRLQTHSFGSYDVTPHAVYHSIDAAKQAPNAWRYLVVTTKALPDVHDESADLEGLVGEGTAVVLIQNGVGVEEPYRRRFWKAPIVSGVTVVSAEQIEPGLIKQNRWTRISLGPYASSPTADAYSRAHESVLHASDAATKEFAALLTEGGIKDAEVYDQRGIQFVRWHKICINAAMNPSAVLSGGTPNATMVKDPTLRAHLHACMAEVFRAAPSILGAPFPSHLAKPEAILRSNERNAGGRPSMLVDWEAGRPMELEVILGNPVRMARAKGAPMDRLESVYALLKMAQRRRDEERKQEKGRESKL